MCFELAVIGRERLGMGVVFSRQIVWHSGCGCVIRFVSVRGQYSFPMPRRVRWILRMHNLFVDHRYVHLSIAIASI